MDEFGIEIPVGIDESNLNKAQNKLKSFFGIANKETKEFSASLKTVSKEFNNIDVPTDDIKKLGAEFSKTTSVAQQSINEQKEALAQMIKTGKKGTKEFNNLSKSLKANITEANKLDKILDDIDREYDIDVDIDVKGESKLSNFKSNLAGLGKGAALAGVAAVSAGLFQAVQLGAEADKAMAKLRATTGATAEEANRLKDVADVLYTEGFGENQADVIEQMGKFQQAMGSLVPTGQTEEVAKVFAGMANATGMSLDEISQKSRTFFQNFEGDAVEKANIISYIQQNANNAEEDVFDTLNEYSNLVSAMGIKAGEFATILTTGIENGARNTDKIADSLKESQIRILANDYAGAFSDLTKSSSGAEQAVSKEIKAILDQAQSGKIEIGEALGQAGDIATEKFKAGELSRGFVDKLAVAIGGTPTEDVGTALSLKLFGTLNDGNDISEQAKKSAELYKQSLNTNLGGFEGLKRTFETLLADLGQSLMPIISMVTSTLKDILPLLTPIIDMTARLLAPVLVTVSETIAKIMPLINELLQRLMPPLTQLIDELGTALAGALGEVLTNLTPLILDLTDLAVLILPTTTKMLTFAIQVVSQFAGVITKIVVPILQVFVRAATEIYTVVLPLFNKVLDKITGTFGRFAGAVSKLLDKLGIHKKLANDVTVENKDLAKSTELVVLKENKQIDVMAKGAIATNNLSTSTQGLTKARKELLKTVNTDFGTNIAIETKTVLELTEAVQEYNDVMGEFQAVRNGVVLNGTRNELQQEIDNYTYAINEIMTGDAVRGGAALIKLLKEQFDGLGVSLDKLDFSSLFEGFKQLRDNREFVEAMTGALYNLSTGLTDTILSDENGAKKWQDIGKKTLSGLKSLIPVIILQTAIEGFLEGGGIGSLLKSGATAVGLYALLSVAENALGAEEGGKITKDYNKKAGKTDTIPMRLAPGEFVVKAKQAKKYGGLLEAVNNDMDISQYIPNSNIHNAIDSSIISNSNDKSLNLAIDKIVDRITNRRVDIYDKHSITINDNRSVKIEHPVRLGLG